MLKKQSEQCHPCHFSLQCTLWAAPVAIAKLNQTRSWSSSLHYRWGSRGNSHFEEVDFGQSFLCSTCNCKTQSDKIFIIIFTFVDIIVVSWSWWFVYFLRPLYPSYRQFVLIIYSPSFASLTLAKLNQTISLSSSSLSSRHHQCHCHQMSSFVRLQNQRKQSHLRTLSLSWSPFKNPEKDEVRKSKNSMAQKRWWWLDSSL